MVYNPQFLFHDLWLICKLLLESPYTFSFSNILLRWKNLLLPCLQWIIKHNKIIQQITTVRSNYKIGVFILACIHLLLAFFLFYLFKNTTKIFHRTTLYMLLVFRSYLLYVICSISDLLTYLSRFIALAESSQPISNQLLRYQWLLKSNDPPFSQLICCNIWIIWRPQLIMSNKYLSS